MPEEAFALRFPFRPLHRVSNLEVPIEWDTDGRRITLSAEEPYLVLRIAPFASEEEAAAFLPSAWGALAWTAVMAGTGFVAEMDVDQIAYAADPNLAGENLRRTFGVPKTGPVHGLVNGNYPSVLPTEKVIRFLTAGDVTGVVSFRVEQLQPILKAALAAPGIGLLHADERFRTAVELFCDQHRERSLRSRFLTLTMALEVLAAPTAKRPIVQELLDAFATQLQAQLESCASGSQDWAALDALRKELTHRRETSVRSSVRQLIVDGLTGLSAEERTARAHDVVWAYDQRSVLVHTGKLDPTELNRAHEIVRSAVRDLLAARMRQGGSETP